MKAKSRKDGTVHWVTRTKPGPHVIQKGGENFTLEGDVHWFACAMWARDVAVDKVDEVDGPVTCLGCIAAGDLA